MLLESPKLHQAQVFLNWTVGLEAVPQSDALKDEVNLALTPMLLLWVTVGAGGIAVEAGAAVAGAEVVGEKPERSLGGAKHLWG